MTSSQWQVLLLAVVMSGEIAFFARVIGSMLFDPPAQGGGVPVRPTVQAPIPARPVESSEIPTQPVKTPAPVEPVQVNRPAQRARPITNISAAEMSYWQRISSTMGKQ